MGGWPRPSGDVATVVLTHSVTHHHHHHHGVAAVRMCPGYANGGCGNAECAQCKMKSDKAPVPAKEDLEKKKEEKSPASSGASSSSAEDLLLGDIVMSGEGRFVSVEKTFEQWTKALRASEKKTKDDSRSRSLEEEGGGGLEPSSQKKVVDLQFARRRLEEWRQKVDPRLAYGAGTDILLKIKHVVSQVEAVDFWEKNSLLRLISCNRKCISPEQLIVKFQK